MVLALSISPTVITWMVILMLLILDWVKCLASRTSIEELPQPQWQSQASHLQVMFRWYQYLNVLLFVIVGLAGFYYFSPAARVTGAVPHRDAIGLAAVLVVTLCGLIPYWVNRVGVKAIDARHIL
jgi:hypothetical protein